MQRGVMEHADFTPNSRAGVVRPRPVKHVTRFPAAADEEGIKRIFADSVAYFEGKPRSSRWHWHWKKAKRIQQQPGWVASIPAPFSSHHAIHTCKYCGDDFPVVNSITYCSDECQQAWRLQRAKEQRKPHDPKRCVRCGDEYVPRSNRQRFCGLACRYADNAEHQRRQRKAG